MQSTITRVEKVNRREGSADCEHEIAPECGDMLGGMVQQHVNRTRARQSAEENRRAPLARRGREAPPPKWRNPVRYSIGESVVL